MPKNKKRVLISLLCNAMIFVLVTMAVSFFFVGRKNAALGVNGAVCFRYFTIDSNVFAALACLVLIPYECRFLKNGGEIPAWVIRFKYIGTVLVTLTLLVVLCYLMPIMGVAPMLAGSNLYLHAICPVLAIVSFLLLEPGSVRKRDALWSTGVVLIYAVVYLVMVVIIGQHNGGWPDFYNFNTNNTWPYFFIGIMCFTYLISRVEIFLKGKADIEDNS